MNPRTKRNTAPLLALAALLAILAWLSNGPMLRALPEAVRLWRMPPAAEVPIPVQGIRVQRIADTWGGARGGGRRHEGTDIFARRGMPVLSATRGIVARIGDYGIGGRHVWVLGPGGERHYYAHLEDWAPGLHATKWCRRATCSASSATAATHGARRRTCTTASTARAAR